MEKTALRRSIFYAGKVLGYEHGHRFEPELDSNETIDFLTEIDIGIRVHLQRLAPALYRLVHHHGLEPDDYINRYEAALYAAEHFQSRQDVHDHATLVWKILHSHRLEKKVFPELQPA